jgi:nitric oxide synthase oxygenase domain/subunit
VKLLIISFSPIPTLKWYRVNSVNNTDKEIGGSDYRLSRFNQFLQITNVGADKAGKYKCVARNPQGLKDEVSGAVKVLGKQ